MGIKRKEVIRDSELIQEILKLDMDSSECPDHLKEDTGAKIGDLNALEHSKNLLKNMVHSGTIKGLPFLVTDEQIDSMEEKQCYNWINHPIIQCLLSMDPAATETNDDLHLLFTNHQELFNEQHVPLSPILEENHEPPISNACVSPIRLAQIMEEQVSDDNTYMSIEGEEDVITSVVDEDELNLSPGFEDAPNSSPSIQNEVESRKETFVKSRDNVSDDDIYSTSNSKTAILVHGENEIEINCSNHVYFELENYRDSNPDFDSLTPIEVVNRFNALRRPKRVFLKAEVDDWKKKKEQKDLSRKAKKRINRNLNALEKDDAQSSTHIFSTPPKHGRKTVNQ